MTGTAPTETADASEPKAPPYVRETAYKIPPVSNRSDTSPLRLVDNGDGTVTVHAGMGNRKVSRDAFAAAVLEMVPVAR